MSDSKKPVTKVSIFPVSAAIWRNEGSNGETFYNVTFERSWKDDAGSWQSSASFSFNELLVLAKVADRAHSEIYELRAKDRKGQQFEE